MHVFLKTLNGKTIVIQIESSDTVDDVKKKVQETEHMPPKSQRLLFGGRQLEDGHKISEYNIMQGSTLYLMGRLLSCSRCYKDIDVQTLSGKTITLEVKPSIRIEDVRAKVHSQQRLLFAGQPLEDERTFAHYKIEHEATLQLDFGMQVFVTMLTGKTKRIRKISGKIQDQQWITDGKQLNDPGKVADYNIPTTQSSLHLDKCRHGGIPIFVMALPSKTIRVKDIGHSDTVGGVKAKIQNQQRLVFDGKQLKDGQTLADYGIQKGSTLHLDYAKNIYVKTPSGQTISLVVELSDTIENVKEKIQHQHRLTFGGKQLEDGRTLSDYDIESDSTLNFDLCLAGSRSG